MSKPTGLGALAGHEWTVGPTRGFPGELIYQEAQQVSS